MKKSIAGIAVFIALALLPFFLRINKQLYKKPDIEIPEGKECIEDTQTMRKNHMTILYTWREKVVRNGESEYTASNGKRWKMSLTKTCMQCHTNKTTFCEKCHNSLQVTIDCWQCHYDKSKDKNS